MTRVLKFYGASDDLFECEGTIDGEPSEIDCFNRNPTVSVCLEEASGNIIGFYVTAIYSTIINNGCWSIAITPLDEDIPIPDWPISIELSERGYSTMLCVVVPDGVKVKELK